MVRNSINHEFGSQDTDLKLSLIEGYLKAFTTALKGKWPQLGYIDAFAGTGRRTVRVAARGGDLFDERVPESIEHRRGSAQIAIDVEPPFDWLIFIDQKSRHCAALRQLKNQNPGRKIRVIEGDANEAIQSARTWPRWPQVRAAMFLDPYGLDVEWETKKAIAAT
jgi:three-Cys-motif partner protein